MRGCSSTRVTKGTTAWRTCSRRRGWLTRPRAANRGRRGRNSHVKVSLQPSRCGRSIAVRRTIFAGFVLLLLVIAAAPSASGATLLDAAAAGDVVAVRALLKQGHDVNAPGEDGATALHWAVRADAGAVVEALLAGGADVSAKNALGVSPISIAASDGNVPLLRRLL